MLVKRTPVAAEFKLLADVDFLITEDWPGDEHRPDIEAERHSHTTPRSAIRRALRRSRS